MDMLLLLAAKSLIVAGGTLLVLRTLQSRSAADRSLVAHLGLAALAFLPVATLLFPALEVARPAFLEAPAAAATPLPSAAATQLPAPEVASSGATFPGGAVLVEPASVDWPLWLYLAPAALLVLLTLVAVGRLAVLKARAKVLVDPHWLSALAQAQRRMDFKNGTALLTSDELSSPISWGLLRPVILLNGDAVNAKSEAEAIIAHELAHVTRLDWAKLLLARVTVAVFWFNPLVWLLAREAHQLREEAADDAVLASDIEDTEYASLLVGIARHECRGLLIGAHGVAPSKNSLARRVKRVLDAASKRAPGGWRWASAAAFFAAGMAVPVAAIQFVTPGAANASSAVVEARPEARGVSAAASAAAVTAATPAAQATPPNQAGQVEPVVLAQPNGGTITSANGQTVLRSPTGGTITVFAPDARGRRRTVVSSPGGSVIAYADAKAVPGLNIAPRPKPSSAIDRAIERKALGVTPGYVESLRNAAPHLRLDHDDVIQLAAVGISPAYIRELAASGYPHLSADDIVQAGAVGISGGYIRSMLSSGLGRLSMDEIVSLKAVGVTAADVAKVRRAGRGTADVEDVIALKAMGIDPDEVEPDE